jgi:hypothetical protein
MPSLTLSQTYHQPTSTLTVRGEAPLPSRPVDGSVRLPLQAIESNFECQLEIRQGETTKTLQGDSVWLKNLITVIDRYVGSQLSGTPKGTFSGTAAIRPLDFISHRLTVRQGEDRIAQVDLSMTQLYDLLENLSQAAEDLPQLDKLATPPTPAWYRQPTAIAALLAGGIVLAAGVGLWVSRRDPPPPPSPPQEQLTAPEAAGDLQQRLESTLAQRWQSPPGLQESLVYRVTVDETGFPLAAEPENAPARERRAITPFADVPEVAPDPLPRGARQFRVSLGPADQVEVAAVQ